MSAKKQAIFKAALVNYFCVEAQGLFKMAGAYDKGYGF